MKLTALTAALGLAFAATASMAADTGTAPTDQTKAQAAAARFKKIDVNGDGKISKAEAQANAPRLAEHFDEIDTNKDGFITPDEMKAARAKREAAKAAKAAAPK
jgi:Ca2+-binding EF-hand superfamily protein